MTTKLLPLSLAAAVGLAVLAAAPAPARAFDIDFDNPFTPRPYPNATETWCKARTAEDQTVVASGDATLVWRADGDLVLEPADAPRVRIWSTGTAGPAPASLCWDADGVLRMRDAAGAVLWFQGQSSTTTSFSGQTYLGEYKLVNRLSLQGCRLAGRRTIYEHQATWFGRRWATVVDGDRWSRDQACPVFTPANTYNGDGWCLDTSQERLIAQTPVADLIWRTHGGLNLVATGSRTGQMWGSGTYGIGKKLCFSNDGRLQIFDAGNAVVWSSSTMPGSITTDHMLGIDGCSLSTRPLEGATTTATWSQPIRCPHEILHSNGRVPAASTEQVVVENDRAVLVLTPDANLVLRTRAGDRIWTSDKPAWAGASARAEMQTDGNLVIWVTNASGVSTPRWSTETFGPNTLELNGCELSVREGANVKWRRGSPSCSFGGPLDINVDLVLKPSGTVMLMRTAESELLWQADGNLVLYTPSGSPVWASGTNGVQRRLAFQLDGNLVVYGPTGALWAAGTHGGTRKLELLDHCTLRVTSETGAVIQTLNDSCTVARYAFERSDGNSLFGTSMRNDLTAVATLGAPSTQTDSNIEVTIFNTSFHVFGAHAYQGKQVDGSTVEVASITIGGDSSFGLNYGHEITFFERSMNFNVGPVPCKVTASATGQLGMSARFDGGTVSVTPAAGLYATVSVGPGGNWGPLSASAGVRGGLTLIELALPISMKVFFDTEASRYKYTVQGDLALDSLSGSVGLYAEASVAGFGVDYSKTIFKWTGVSWNKPLFSKTGTF